MTLNVTNKNLDVYAIGNALVDTEYVVSDQKLAELEVAKGLMTLVDANRSLEIATKSGAAHKKECGGSAANTVMALGQLGGKGFYSFKVGDDENGNFYLADLARNGISFKENYTAEKNGITGTCQVLITDDAQRSMNTFLGCSSTLSFNEASENDLKNAKYLYIEGYLVTSDSAFDAVMKSIKIAKKAGVKIALTLSDPMIVQGFKDRFQEIISTKIDLIFANHEEALSITGSTDVESAVNKLGELCSEVVVTLSDKGSLVYSNDKTIESKGRQVNVLNTNGAGDMFAGAYLYARTQGHSEKISADLANFLSSKVVEVYGPRLEMSIVQSLKKEFFA
jgi:sugar/nucleoside kinase (ribokinase family)